MRGLIVLSITLAITLTAGLQRISTFAGAENAETIATNLSGFRAYRTPPEGFDPYSGSNSELARYGLPARPEPSRQPVEYRVWQMLVDASQYRVVPDFEISKIYHPPIRGFKAGKKPGKVNGRVAPTPSTSTNWSGFVINDSNNFFNSVGSVSAFFNVPAVTDCTVFGPRQWSSDWVGVDGFVGSSDVFQAGTSSDADCGAGPGNHSLYYAWVEWFPNPVILLNRNFPIVPGDSMSVTVVTNPPQNLYVLTLFNYSRHTSVSIPMAPPPGVKLVGNSIEWVVERPTVNGVESILAPYSRSGWQTMIGYYVQGQAQYRPSLAPTGTSYDDRSSRK